MRVQIIGAGSVGLLMASFLAEANVQTIIVCKTNEQAEKLQQKLIRTNVDLTTVEVQVDAQTTMDELADLTIVAVKSGQVAELLHSFNKQKPIIFCQNGLAHYYLIEQHGFSQVIYASAQFGALKKQHNHVLHKGVGVLKLATNQSMQAIQLFSKLSNELFPIQIEENAEKMLFEKALLNCFINPLTALMHMKNGELIENEHTYTILQRLHKEFVEVFKKECVSFEQVVQLCKNTAYNTSSMLADHLASRRSEAPYIMGAVIERAKVLKKEVPTLTALYHLVLAKEEQGGFKN